MTIKEQRLSKGLTREKLAQLSGVTHQTIWRAEKTEKITYQTYLKIQNALNNYLSDNSAINPVDLQVEVVR